jgi:predicted metal-binding membrane protein
MSWIDTALRRERAPVLLGLAALVALAWAWLWQGAGMGMSAWDMTAAALFPHRLPDARGDMAASGPVVVAMWWVMMVAMMTPTAAPLVLLHLRVLQHRGEARAAALSLVLLSGYLGMWFAFSVAAAALQILLQPTGWLSPMMLWSRSAPFSAAVLAAAGAYQLTPLKHACLSRCRHPATFLQRHWRAGWWGALRLGLLHGADCLGCCWALMLLLFVGGVMNLLWIALLSLLVLAEKLLPHTRVPSHAGGVLLLVWAAVTLFVPG